MTARCRAFRQLSNSSLIGVLPSTGVCMGVRGVLPISGVIASCENACDSGVACFKASFSPWRTFTNISNCAILSVAASNCLLSLSSASVDFSKLTATLFRMLLARLAYLSVFSVSSSFAAAGYTQAIITVRLFRPCESFSILVSFESRYGT